MHTPELLELDHLFKIQNLDGYSRQFSQLISMMNYARITMFDAIKGLSISDLDFLVNENANSIGMLLLHIASVEFEFHKETIENRELTAVEIERWKPALELGDLGRSKIKGHSLDFYIDQLAQVRKKPWRIFKL